MKTPKRLLAALCFMLLSVSCQRAMAVDGEPVLGAGGLYILQKSLPISLASEELEISVSRVEARYRFRNDSDAPLDATLAFTMPELNGETLYNGTLSLPDENKSNFLDFEATAGGMPVVPLAQKRATFEHRDVTARLKEAGLPEPDVMPEVLNATLLRLKPKAVQALAQEKLIIPADYNPALRRTGLRQGWRAAWTQQAQFTWKQHFAPHEMLELTQRYRPVVGGSYLYLKQDGSERSSIAPYCGGEETLQAMARIKADHPGKGKTIDLWERKIDYDLAKTAREGGPIGHFHLTILTDNADDILLSCMGGIKHTEPMRYELVRTAFQPDTDLKLLILQRNQ